MEEKGKGKFGRGFLVKALKALDYVLRGIVILSKVIGIAGGIIFGILAIIFVVIAKKNHTDHPELWFLPGTFVSILITTTVCAIVVHVKLDPIRKALHSVVITLEDESKLTPEQIMKNKMFVMEELFEVAWDEITSALRIALFGLPATMILLGIAILASEAKKYHSLAMKILGGLVLAWGIINFLVALVVYVILIRKLGKIKKQLIEQIKNEGKDSGAESNLIANKTPDSNATIEPDNAMPESQSILPKNIKMPTWKL